MIHKLNTFRTGITVLIGLTLLLGWSTSHATDFCVSDATKLQKALTEAAYNEQDDTIQIVQGDYVGNFVYASTKAHNLTITGGDIPPTARQEWKTLPIPCWMATKPKRF